jgi:hypothetical protein
MERPYRKTGDKALPLVWIKTALIYASVRKYACCGAGH